MRRVLLWDAVMLAAIWYFMLPSPAQAYFDLNTGTYLVQLIFGFGVAFWFSFKNNWLQIFKKKTTKPIDTEVSPENHKSSQ